MGRKRKYITKHLSEYVIEGTTATDEKITDYSAWFKDHPEFDDKDDGNPITDEIDEVYQNFHFGFEYPYKPEATKDLDMTHDKRMLREPEYFREHFMKQYDIHEHTKYCEVIKQWEKDFKENLINDLAETYLWGDSKPELKKHVSFPANNTGKLGSPVRVPTWIWAAPSFAEVIFHFDRIQAVAMAHVLHFTLNGYPTGYIEKSGHIETWCRCTVEEAHNSLMDLYNKGLVFYKFLPPELVDGAARNMGWYANVHYIQHYLDNYGRRIDK